MENKPEWMNDSLVKNIDEKKLAFLNDLVLGGRGKSQKEAMPYMMLKMKQVKGTAIFHLSAAASYFTLLEIMMNKDRWMMIFQ